VSKPRYVWSWRLNGWVGPWMFDGLIVLFRYEHDTRWIGKGYWEPHDIGIEYLRAAP
jgi:hypothetical protein